MSHLSLTGKASNAKQDDVISLPRWTMRAWRRVFMLLVIAFLLGRASIEHTVSPFGLAYFVILSEVAGRKRSWPAYAAVLGAWTHGGMDAAIGMAVQFLLYQLTRRLIFRAKTPDLHWIPLTAGIVSIVAKMAMVGTVWTKYDLLVALSEGALVMILCLIFLQCMAIFIGQDHSKSLRHE